MKIISDKQLHTVDPNKECFIIKSQVSQTVCDEVVSFLSVLLSKYKPNEKFNGNNWLADIEHNKTFFHSFVFDSLKALNHQPLYSCFQTLFDAYQKLGANIKGDFGALISDNVKVESKGIKPLVFLYSSGVGEFDWHQHPSEHQQFQLLLNLTDPTIDYTGGATTVRMDKGEETFGSQFKKGGMFSFPYTNWHKVNHVFSGTGNLKSRISLLMPLQPQINLYYDDVT
ncbi:MAG: hypothetical protein AAEA78_02995 [Methylophilaceae bacterium]